MTDIKTKMLIQTKVVEVLTQLAAEFDTYASDQRASKRWQSSAKDKRDCELRAKVWEDAASDVRGAIGRVNYD